VHRLRFRIHLLSGILIIVAFVLAIAGNSNVLAANTTVDEKELTAEQILQNVVDSQYALKDFTARAKMELFLNKTRFPVSMQIFARRPNATAVKVMGVTVQSKGGLLLPSPTIFLNSGEYDLSIGGIIHSSEGKLYIVNVRPKVKTPENYFWRLEIAADPWVVKASEAHDGQGQSTRLEAEYQKVMEGCWLPVKFEGKGSMLLKTALPEGFINWLFNVVAKGKEVRYVLTLSDVKVNVGIPDSMFK
jgi:hypothetical protein